MSVHSVLWLISLPDLETYFVPILYYSTSNQVSIFTCWELKWQTGCFLRYAECFAVTVANHMHSLGFLFALINGSSFFCVSIIAYSIQDCWSIETHETRYAEMFEAYKHLIEISMNDSRYEKSLKYWCVLVIGWEGCGWGQMGVEGRGMEWVLYSRTIFRNFISIHFVVTYFSSFPHKNEPKVI